MQNIRRKHMRRVTALLLTLALLVTGGVPVFAADGEDAYTLEVFDNIARKCAVLVVTANGMDAFGAIPNDSENKENNILIRYTNQYGVYTAYEPDTENGDLIQQAFTQDGKVCPQLFIRLPDFLPDGSGKPRVLPMTAVLELPAGLFRSGETESPALRAPLSSFRRMQFTVELTGEKLTYDNRVVVGMTELTPTFLCDGLCAEAYAAQVRYYPVSQPEIEGHGEPGYTDELTAPFTPNRETWSNVCAYINDLAYCSGFVSTISRRTAYWKGLRTQIVEDSWKILPCFLLAIPGMFIVTWPGIWFGPMLLSAGAAHASLLFRSIFAPLTPNKARFRMNGTDQFSIYQYWDGLNGGGWHGVRG